MSTDSTPAQTQTQTQTLAQARAVQPAHEQAHHQVQKAGTNTEGPAFGDDSPLEAGLSTEAIRRIASADAWNQDRFAAAEASVRRAWAAAATGAVVGVLGLGTALLALRTPPAPPMAVVVDRSTGQSQVISRVSDADVPSLAVLDQHNAASYVRAREAYHPALLQRDYDAVARMTTPDAFKPYNERYTGERAQHRVLGTSQEHRITVISARPTQLATPTTQGEMVVTFDREVRYAHGQSPVLTRHLATLRYEYRPGAMTQEIDRIENPFGFLVSAYRVDTELAAPQPIPAFSPSTGAGPGAATTPATVAVPAAAPAPRPASVPALGPAPVAAPIPAPPTAAVAPADAVPAPRS